MRAAHYMMVTSRRTREPTRRPKPNEASGVLLRFGPHFLCACLDHTTDTIAYVATDQSGLTATSPTHRRCHRLSRFRCGEFDQRNLDNRRHIVRSIKRSKGRRAPSTRTVVIQLAQPPPATSSDASTTATTIENPALRNRPTHRPWQSVMPRTCSKNEIINRYVTHSSPS
jgi:hypothetical protein